MLRKYEFNKIKPKLNEKTRKDLLYQCQDRSC